MSGDQLSNCKSKYPLNKKYQGKYLTNLVFNLSFYFYIEKNSVKRTTIFIRLAIERERERERVGGDILND